MLHILNRYNNIYLEFIYTAMPERIAWRRGAGLPAWTGFPSEPSIRLLGSTLWGALLTARHVKFLSLARSSSAAPSIASQMCLKMPATFWMKAITGMSTIWFSSSVLCVAPEIVYSWVYVMASHSFFFCNNRNLRPSNLPLFVVTSPIALWPRLSKFIFAPMFSQTSSQNDVLSFADTPMTIL